MKRKTLKGYQNFNEMLLGDIHYQCIRGNLKKTDMDWEFFPEGLGYFLRRIKYEYDSKIPIYVTENGMANRDQINIKNEILDDK